MRLRDQWLIAIKHDFYLLKEESFPCLSFKRDKSKKLVKEILRALRKVLR